MRKRDAVSDPDSPESMRAGDPEFDHLWDMTYEDFRKIEQDPAHPLHAKAQVISAEIMEPFATAIQASTAPARTALTENLGEWAKTALKPLFDVSAYLSETQTPNIAKTAERMAEALSPAIESTKTMQTARPLSPSDRPGPIRSDVDFTADAAPEGVTVSQVHDAAQTRVIEQLAGMLKIADEQLAHARDRARVEDERADQQSKRDVLLDARHRDTTKLNRWSIIGAWTAAVLTFAGIVVSVIIAVSQAS